MRGIAGRGRVWVGLWLALALLPGVAVAQFEESAEHTCDTPVSAPVDVTLHLSIESSQKVFREGEIIPLQATFASTSPERYWVAGQGFDHGGRQQMETFCLTPAKGTDPLAGYFLETENKFGFEQHAFLPAVRQHPVSGTAGPERVVEAAARQLPCTHCEPTGDSSGQRWRVSNG